MLTWLAELSPYFSPLNLFRYITFRTGGATATALLFVLPVRPVDHLARCACARARASRSATTARNPISQARHADHGRPDDPAGVLVSTLLWADLANPYVWVVLLVTVGFGAIGFFDDYLKVTKQSHKGFSGKLAAARSSSLIAGIACIAIIVPGDAGLANKLALPFSKDLVFNLGWFYIVFAALRDRRRRQCGEPDRRPRRPRHRAGDDRRPAPSASSPISPATRCSPNYLQIHFVPGTGELAVLCGALIGAGLGFLWFNAPPAAVFMGDTGSLALGGALGAIAVATKHEFVLAIVGGLFVLETLSVIIQVASFKLHRQARLPDGADPPPFRADRLDRADRS